MASTREMIEEMLRKNRNGGGSPPPDTPNPDRPPVENPGSLVRGWRIKDGPMMLPSLENLESVYVSQRGDFTPDNPGSFEIPHPVDFRALLQDPSSGFAQPLVDTLQMMAAQSSSERTRTTAGCTALRELSTNSTASAILKLSTRDHVASEQLGLFKQVVTSLKKTGKNAEEYAKASADLYQAIGGNQKQVVLTAAEYGHLVMGGSDG